MYSPPLPSGNGCPGGQSFGNQLIHTGKIGAHVLFAFDDKGRVAPETPEQRFEEAFEGSGVDEANRHLRSESFGEAPGPPGKALKLLGKVFRKR